MTKFSRLLLSAVFAVGMSLGFSARAEILVYDGFPTGSGAYSTKDKSKLSDQAAGNFTTSSIFGFDPKNWRDSTGVIYSFTSGLTLPEGFDALPSSAYVGAGSAGASADGYNDERGQYKQLSSAVIDAMKSAKELHFRFLIHADLKALTALTVNSTDGNVPNKSAYAAGLCLATSMNYGTVRNSEGKTARSLGFAIRKVGGTDSNPVANLSLLVMGSEDGTKAKDVIRTYDILTSIDPSKTYLCYAKIVVGATPSDPEQISAMAQAVDAYDPSAPFANIGNNGVVTANLIDDTGTGAPNYINFAAGSYTTKKGYFQVDEFALATSGDDIMHLGIPGAPAVQNATLTGSNGSYSLSATVTKAAATDAGALVQASDESVKFSAGEVAVDGNFVQPFTTASLSADKTYEVAAYAKNDAAAVTNAVGTVYTGILTLEKVRDADEYQCKPGEVTVSRANADPYPLAVNYTFSSATEGATAGKTWVAPEPVVIPADETSATIKLTPIVDADIGEDITVTLSLTAGNYPAVAQTVDLTLANLVAPEGYNTWVATASGKASVAENWSEGRVPISTDKILFDGDFSNADCEWDGDTVGGPSATIAELKMGSSYSGTVTVLTTFPEVAGSSFHVFTVTGDVEMEGGTISHAAHDSTHKCDYYRLRMDVGGDLTVASGASINATGKGSYGGRSGVGVSTYGGSYDGGKTFGSLTEPYEVGSSANADNVYTAPAGGAIWIEVEGKAAVNGSIKSDSVSAWGQWNDYSGSGGAVYLKAASLVGSGKLSANCTATKRGSNSQTGAGGRVSVLLGAELTDFPAANITAFAGYTSYSHVGGVGTVLIRTPNKPNGILYLIDQKDKYGQYGYRPRPNQMTDIPAEQTWTVDGIVFGYNAILRVPTGTVLNLVNGLDSVSATSTERENGILVEGGALALPEVATHTISGAWMLQMTNGTINGNLSIENGGAIGTHMIYSDTVANLRRCQIAVTGDVTIDKNSYLYARRGGYIATGAAFPGGTALSCHGGQNAKNAGNCAYDSFFNPTDAGAFGKDVGFINVGGGAVKLTVGGTLTLNGTATAKPINKDSRPGAGGSFNISAAYLVGDGLICADGDSREYGVTDVNAYGASGGGRVAVRLTGVGAEFTSEWLSKITARGVSSNVGDKQAISSSAGSVYLQSAAQGEKCGTIIIRNDNKTANDAWTALPGKDGVDAIADFKHASLSLLDCGKVRLYDSLQMFTVSLSEDCRLDLNGTAMKVKKLVLGGTSVAGGTYAAGDAALGDFVTDSVGGGSVIVSGTGLLLIVR